MGFQPFFERAGLPFFETLSLSVFKLIDPPRHETWARAQDSKFKTFQT